METGNLQISLRRFNATRQRFTVREHFFQRCIADINDDFHKQYGPFYQDWEMMLEASQQYRKAVEDYLRTRDIIAMEFKLLLGALDEAETEYACKKATKRFTDLMATCEQNDTVTLAEIDEDIANIRAVYRMIALAECEREE